MKRNQIIIIAVVAIAAIVAAAIVVKNQSRNLIIEGQLIGLDSTSIYLEQSVNNERIIVDSIEMRENGAFRLKVENAPSEPTLYELRCGWDRVPVLGKRGETINITSLGRFARNYVIEGSKESELLRTFYQPYVKESAELRQIAAQYAAAQQSGEDVSEFSLAYGTLYNDIKRAQIKFIIENKGNLAALYALFQRLPGDTNLISESNDIIYMRTVADSVIHNYPNSSYLKVLQRAIEEEESRFEMINRVEYSDFPEIVMGDMFGVKRSLSSLKGSVILLDFWSAEFSKGNPNNAVLKEIYADLHNSGFEVYQVGVDTSKSTWINTVQQQRLPWVSVSDLLGGSSPALGLYNITSIPSNILISREGEVVGRDLYDDELRQAIIKQLK